jgi:IS1 family transposase
MSDHTAAIIYEKMCVTFLYETGGYPKRNVPRLREVEAYQRRSSAQFCHITGPEDSKSLQETVERYHDSSISTEMTKTKRAYDNCTTTLPQVDGNRIKITIISTCVCDDSDNCECAQSSIYE